VRIRLSLETVPVAAAAIAEARRMEVPFQQFAAEGGDDYELLVALPAEFGEADARAFESATGIALTRVGAVERGSGVRAELLSRGLELRGYDHFR
jgi:thiamine monophosphate kinase